MNCSLIYAKPHHAITLSPLFDAFVEASPVSVMMRSNSHFGLKPISQATIFRTVWHLGSLWGLIQQALITSNHFWETPNTADSK